MSLRDDLLSIVKAEFTRQEDRLNLREMEDDALMEEPAHLKRADEIISNIKNLVQENSRYHNFHYNRKVEAEVMHLFEKDYRKPKVYRVGTKEKDNHYRDPKNLRGAAQLVYLYLAKEKLIPFFMSTGFRPGFDDAGYSLYISIEV